MKRFIPLLALTSLALAGHLALTTVAQATESSAGFKLFVELIEDCAVKHGRGGVHERFLQVSQE